MEGEIGLILFFVREIEKWDSHKGKSKKRHRSRERDELKRLRELCRVCVIYLEKRFKQRYFIFLKQKNSTTTPFSHHMTLSCFFRWMHATFQALTYIFFCFYEINFFVLNYHVDYSVLTLDLFFFFFFLIFLNVDFKMIRSCSMSMITFLVFFFFFFVGVNHYTINYLVLIINFFVFCWF